MNAVIRVVGRAFYDGAHSHGTHKPNRRDYDPNTTIWEAEAKRRRACDFSGAMHPVMSLDVVK